MLDVDSIRTILVCTLIVEADRCDCSLAVSSGKDREERSVSAGAAYGDYIQ